jgi:hypothetical protein
MNLPLPVSPDLADALSTPAATIATPAPVDSLPAIAPTPSKEDFWRKAIHNQAASGKSILDFCHERGLAYGTFHRWKRALTEAGRTSATSDPAAATPSVQDDVAAFDASSTVALEASPAPLPRFAEIRLSTLSRQVEASAPASLELRCGKFALAIRPECDRVLLREVLGMLGEVSC